jgi:(2Fe-2S) ferredoxin
MSRRPTVFVCRGSRCRRANGCRDLADCLTPVADVEEVRCQRVCDGPVVGTEVDGTLEWFRRMDSDKARRHLVALVAEGARLKKPLARRHVRKRSGVLR